MKLFLYTYQSIGNRMFITVKMEALLTATWWLGRLPRFYLTVLPQDFLFSMLFFSRSIILVLFSNPTLVSLSPSHQANFPASQSILFNQESCREPHLTLFFVRLVTRSTPMVGAIGTPPPPWVWPRLRGLRTFRFLRWR